MKRYLDYLWPIIGLAAVGMPGKESVILQNVLKYCVLYTVVGGLVCYFLPMIL